MWCGPQRLLKTMLADKSAGREKLSAHKISVRIYCYVFALVKCFIFVLLCKILPKLFWIIEYSIKCLTSVRCWRSIGFHCYPLVGPPAGRAFECLIEHCSKSCRCSVCFYIWMLWKRTILRQFVELLTTFNDFQKLFKLRAS